MPKIYDLTPSYRAGRTYVTYTFRHYYGKFIVLGKENIPSEGPVIFGPNHLNALMDALMVLTSTPKELSDVFLARSDIFKNKTAAKILRFLKILPAFRMRDGIENLNKNNDTFAEAYEVLETKNALCLMPEGNQGDQRKLRPMVKGLFRIAFTAQEKYGNEPGVTIVPVGLDYSDRVKFGSDVIILYGKPIQVSEYMDQYRENPALAINELRARFKEELHKLTLDLATETNYDCFETVVEVANTAAVQQLKLKNNVENRFYARRKIGDCLIDMEKNDPSKTEKLVEACKDYAKNRKKVKLPLSVLEKPYNAFCFILSFLLLIATLPVFLTGFVLNMFPFLLPGVIRRAMKIKYDGFFSSFQYVLGAIFTFPLFYLIQTVLFAIFSPTPWWVVPIFAVAQFLLGKFSFGWYKQAVKWIDNLRYRWMKLTKSAVLKKDKEMREKIISFVNIVDK